MSKKKFSLIVFFIVIVIIIFYIGSNVSFNKVVAEQSGMFVSDFVINDSKTVPSHVEPQNIDLDVSIAANRFFSFYNISGDINIEGISYNIISADLVDGEYTAALTSSNMNEMAGVLKISDDLEFFSIQLNNSNNYIVGPAKTREDAVEIIHTLYGG